MHFPPIELCRILIENAGFQVHKEVNKETNRTNNSKFNVYFPPSPPSPFCAIALQAGVSG